MQPLHAQQLLRRNDRGFRIRKGGTWGVQMRTRQGGVFIHIYRSERESSHGSELRHVFSDDGNQRIRVSQKRDGRRQRVQKGRCLCPCYIYLSTHFPRSTLPPTLPPTVRLIHSCVRPRTLTFNSLPSCRITNRSMSTGSWMQSSWVLPSPRQRWPGG